MGSAVTDVGLTGCSAGLLEVGFFWVGFIDFGAGVGSGVGSGVGVIAVGVTIGVLTSIFLPGPMKAGGSFWMIFRVLG